MNAEEFLQHHGLVMNPFVAEDAVQDAVLARATSGWKHPDFAKILGEAGHPAPTVVFGERGAGKTALRLQMEQALDAWNERRGDARVLVIDHDHFDTMLTAIARHDGLRDPAAALDGIRLSDHIDAMLHSVVPPLVDQILGMPGAELLRVSGLRRALRKAPPAVRRDMLLLQVAYDHPSAAARRSQRLRSALRTGGSSGAAVAGTWALLLLGMAGMLALLGVLPAIRFMYLIPAALLGCAGLVAWWNWVLRKGRVARVARRLSKAIRVLQRDGRGFRPSLHMLPMDVIEGSLPQDRGEDARYVMLDRLKRVLSAVGYASITVLVDRVDEPACVAGDPQRMRALVWPLLSSRFLQHAGLAVKLLLPKELGDLAAREDGEFHRGARLDKQNLVDRLHWSGAMLAELCDARLLAAARRPSQALKVEDLFEASVGRARIAEALERAGNPREAFRLIYGAIQEHLSHAGADEARVSGGALEWVRRRQADARMARG